MSIIAIVPARSGSKRFKNKNITDFLGTPLFLHSIFFAKKLKFVKKIILTSDSKKYLSLAKNISKVLIHKRTKKNSKDNSMEEDILFELSPFLKKYNIKFTGILWLRPTHPLRCLNSFKQGYKIFKKKKETVVIVHKEESRLFYERNKYLYPVLESMKNRSMIRSQRVKPFYSIFSGEFFHLKKINKKFLGDKFNFVVAPKYTKIDIDTKTDKDIISSTIKSNKKKFKKFIHV
jgi:CMP-N,N'-diacetyllegionaminic acid synthase